MRALKGIQRNQGLCVCVCGGGRKKGRAGVRLECGPVVGQELPEIVKARQGPRTLEGQMPEVGALQACLLVWGWGWGAD